MAVDKATLEQWLTEAQEAEQRLFMGEQEVKITNEDGVEVTFNRTTVGMLKRRIQYLKRELGYTGVGVRITT